MLKESAIVLLVAASIISPSAFLIIENSQTQMDTLNNQFITVMNGTMGFLDNAWDVAQQFQDPNYHYDPSDLGNYTNQQSSSVIG